MQQYFELDNKEKKQEWLMLIFAAISFLIIGKGVYNQYHNIDQDNILVPLVLLMYCGFFFIYGINAFAKGNLIPKWTPFFIFQFTFFLIRKFSSKTREKARAFAAKFLGTLAIILSIGFLISAILLLTQNK